ncbi:hypothetical protein CAEBREN_04118 [Caenorhabditis brenneri]|uniref:Uncharacterized protein n=1 Tax=Caenorhabditis brenneri TaxID=135651 RepID=G0P1G1_CAEBE|nr:hypothetical protein CAEBREN_04118 [Caenorhabditis brenneri]
MKKRIIKKKTVPPTPSDDVEMPMSTRMNDADDVAEDHKIFDMSQIAAPVIEFEMPNLEEKKFEKSVEKQTDSPKKTGKKPEKTVKKSAKKPEISGEKLQLTAEKLNNELVSLRAVIVKAKNQLMSKSVRQKKELEAKLKKEGIKGKEEIGKKVERILEEILGLKSIDKDTIAKFAALNTKSLNELKINGKTPVAERLMYKLACQEIVVEKVQETREKYIEWSKTAAFFMQRLGQQYANKPEKSVKNGSKKADPEEEEDPEDSESEDVEDSSTPEGSDAGDEDDYNQSDVEMVDSDEEQGVDAAKKRRSLLLGLIGAKEDKSRPALNPKKRKIEEEDTPITSGSKKTKEDVKKEMKEILKKELKTKEAAAPKKVNPKARKPVAPKKVVAPKKEEDSDASEEPELEEEDPNQKTLIMKVDLSKGGKIAKTPKSMAPAAPEEEEDDDESASFFLPKSSQAPPTKRKPIVKAMETLEVTKKKERGADKKKPAQPAAKPLPPAPEKKKGSSKNQTSLGESHPSWVASQLKKKELAAAKPCGKKMTFADSDDE